MPGSPFHAGEEQRSSIRSDPSELRRRRSRPFRSSAAQMAFATGCIGMGAEGGLEVLRTGSFGAHRGRSALQIWSGDP